MANYTSQRYAIINARGKVINHQGYHVLNPDEDYSNATTIRVDNNPSYDEGNVYWSIDSSGNGSWATITDITVTFNSIDTNDPNEIIETVDGSGNIVTCVKGSTVTCDVILNVPLTQVFRMPYKASFETRYTLANFVNGNATFSVNVDRSALWKITADEINKSLVEVRFTFDDLSVFVVS